MGRAAPAAPRTLVVGLGQDAAGDDGVGLAVARHLASRPLPAGTEVRQVADPAALLGSLAGVDRLVVVDAVVDGGEPGRVLVLGLDDLRATRPAAASSHGLDLATVLGLDATLGAPRPTVEVVGVVIAPPRKRTLGLSRPVADAVPRAAACVLRLLAGAE